MKYLIILFLIFGLVSICYADRICIEKLTGKLIEYQSGGSTQKDLDVMVQNAVNCGYKKEDIEVKFITLQQWEIIRQEQITKPAQDLAKQKEVERQTK